MAERETEHRNAHEQRDVSPQVPVWIAVCTLALIAVSIALVVWLMQTLWAPPETPAGPFSDTARTAPHPTLQANPQADLTTLKSKWQRQLQTYGWVDESAGIARIPIDAAMNIIAEQGLPRGDRIPDVLREAELPEPEDQ